MARAFITVETATGKSSPLLDEVTTTPGVEEAHVVAGQYDIIAEATGQEVYDLIHSVATNVRDLEGVVDTRTYICLE